jgi:hypothetical protein
MCNLAGTSNSAVKTFNIQGTNGVIQIVDKILQPFFLYNSNLEPF